MRRRASPTIRPAKYSTSAIASLPRAGALRVEAASATLVLCETADGIEVRVESGGIRIVSQGQVAVRAEQLSIAVDGDLSLRAGGAITLESAAAVSVAATEIALNARVGDVAVVANDDVRLEGERVRMNS